MMNNTLSGIEKPKILTLDLETTGLSWQNDQIILIGYRIDEGEVKQINYSGQMSADNYVEFSTALKNPAITKRGHNIKFDILFLLANGFEVNGELDCTSVLCYLKDPFSSTRLKDNVEKILKKKVVRMEDFAIKPKKKELHNFKNNPDFFEIDKKFYDKKVMFEYNVDDVINCDSLRNAVDESDWYKRVEQPLVKFLVEIEQRGIQLNIDYLKQLKFEFENELKVIEMELGDINAKSPKQVKAELNKQGLKCSKTDKLVLKKFSWDGNNYTRTLLRFRELSKLNSTYVLPLIEEADSTGRIHGSFNQSGTDKSSGGTKTGRLTSSDPNLQNIPSRTKEGQKIRKAFVPTENYVMFDTDLRQIEPRLIAHFSQAPKLIKAFAQGMDTHGMFASDIFEKPVDKLTKMERFIGKTSWLATLYGCYYKKLLVISQINSDEAIPYNEEYFRTVQDKFWKANPELGSWRTQEISQARQLGYITTIGGRKIYIPNLHARSFFDKAEAERQVINYKIQGSAADIMKLILVRFKKEFVDKGKGHVLASVHDEVLGEFPTEKCRCSMNCTEVYESDMLKEIDSLMTTTVQLNNVKIEADTKIVSNWGDK